MKADIAPSVCLILSVLSRVLTWRIKVECADREVRVTDAQPCAGRQQMHGKCFKMERLNLEIFDSVKCGHRGMLCLCCCS